MVYDPGPLSLLRLEQRAALLESERFNPFHGKGGKFASGNSGPGSGVDLIAAGKADEIAGAAYEAAGRELPGNTLYYGGPSPGMGPHGDEALHSIIRTQGFDGKPRTLSSRDMNKGIRKGDTEMFRGVDARDGKTPEQIHEQIRSGEDYQGRGAFGNGTYMTPSHREASTYGTVGRYSLDRNARVIDYDQLQTEQGNFLQSIGYKDVGKFTVKNDSITGQVFSDPGRYAAARGYDAIRVSMPGSDYKEYVVLNRTALIAEVQ